MQAGKIYRGPDVLIDYVWRADNVFTRMRGLLARPALKPDQGLVIVPCSSIHTLGMSYSLDIVFLDDKNRVVKIVEHMQKRRMAMALGANWTLELLAGEIQRLGISIGDELQWRKK